MKKNIFFLLLLGVLGITACKHPSLYKPPFNYNAYSQTPAFVKTMDGFSGVEIFPLISSEDSLAESPSFIFAGQPDGGGLIANPWGKGYLMITNHEGFGAVSRVYLDEKLKPFKGEYIVDYQGSKDRLCSATLATYEEHGIAPIFLGGGEGNIESRILGVSPFAAVENKGAYDKMLPSLGRRKAENALPLNKNVYPNKTVVIVTEDDFNGQLYAYVSNTVGDLATGDLYVLRRKDLETNEMTMSLGNEYEVEFVKIETDVRNISGVKLDSISRIDLKAINFARLEDIDYGKGSLINNRNLYFTATGVTLNGINPYPDKCMWGRVYQLSLDENSPLTGKLKVIMDGDDESIYTHGVGITNPDNVCATEHYVYIQEDGDSHYAGATHDSYIWQYDIANRTYKPFLIMNHQRDNATFNDKYNTTHDTRLASWEFGAMYDISDLTDTESTFIVNIHSHTWQNSKFINADGGGSVCAEGGQSVILKGVPK